MIQVKPEAPNQLNRKSLLNTAHLVIKQLLICVMLLNDAFAFEYTCNCGNKGKVHIEFDRNVDVDKSDIPLNEVKNRLCCPKDKSLLVTLVNKNLISKGLEMSCIIR